METMRMVPGFGRSATADATWWALEAAGQKAVKWLWPGRVPLGRMTLLIGDPGRGKSLLALDMAARVTRGAAWPDQGAPGAESLVASGTGNGPGGEERAPAGERRMPVFGPPEAAPEPLDPALAELAGVVDWPPETEPDAGEAGVEAAKTEAEPPEARPETPNPVGSVVLLSAEDDPGDTILPRLRAAGGDPERVVILHSLRRLTDGKRLTFSLSRDLSLLDYEMRARGDVRLVVFDPVTAYLGGLHGHSNAEVQDLLAPVRELAENRGAAVLGISHLTKKSDVALLYRAMGSLAFVAASRSVWVVGPDRREAGRMLFLPVKCNLVGGATGLAYRIVGSEGDPAVPVLAWEAEAVAEEAEEALGAVRRAPAGELAAMWLRGLLAAGPRATRDVERLAAAVGISPTALRKARKALGVEGHHSGAGNAWALSLPERETASPVATEARAAMSEAVAAGAVTGAGGA
ncbi:MAG: hypothetical protein FJ290_27725 [Planctomycetes bacterium]|nr:hypothetical protein [Planctomycetota bacterium]